MTPTIDAKPAKEDKGQPRDQEKKNGIGEALRFPSQYPLYSTTFRSGLSRAIRTNATGSPGTFEGESRKGGSVFQVSSQ